MGGGAVNEPTVAKIAADWQVQPELEHTADCWQRHERCAISYLVYLVGDLQRTCAAHIDSIDTIREYLRDLTVETDQMRAQRG